jgi:hypothetical protein
MSVMGLVSRGSPVHTAVRNCTRDEGRSFEVGNQVLISSHRKLLSSVRWPIACAMQHGLLLWVIRVEGGRGRPSMHFRCSPKS